MDNREEYGNRQQNEGYRQDQPEQWDDRSYRGRDQDRNDRSDWQSYRADNYDENDGYGRDDRYEGGRRYSRENRSSRTWGGEDRDRGEVRGHRGGHYDPSSQRGYGRFTSESYGGRDYSDTARAPVLQLFQRQAVRHGGAIPHAL